MSEIKQINTGVAELLAVKVPEGSIRFAIELDALFCHIKAGVYKLIKLPPGNWIPLGIDTELTEEQCRQLFKNKDGYGQSFELPAPNHRSAYFTAIGAFTSLMQANGCYSVNPLGEKPERFTGNTPFGFDENVEALNRLADTLIEKWQQAEANTGTWLILTKKENGS